MNGPTLDLIAGCACHGRKLVVDVHVLLHVLNDVEHKRFASARGSRQKERLALASEVHSGLLLLGQFCLGIFEIKDILTFKSFKLGEKIDFAGWF